MNIRKTKESRIVQLTNNKCKRGGGGGGVDKGQIVWNVPSLN